VAGAVKKVYSVFISQKGFGGYRSSKLSTDKNAQTSQENKANKIFGNENKETL
jgi:hypothetical protein